MVTPGLLQQQAPVKFNTEVPDTPFNQRLAEGHANRLGHALVARHVSADGVLWHKVALCCGEQVPDYCASWGEE